MNDEQIESLMRRVRPRGPDPELRDRSLAPVARTWPWMAAAAALLLMTLGAHTSSMRTYAAIDLLVTPAEHDELAVLREALGDDEGLVQQTLWRAEWARQAGLAQESRP